MANNELIEDIKNRILPILREHNIKKAGIFGSYARGEQKKRSDVDILVKIPESWSLLAVAGLKTRLDIRLKKKVDLVEYELIRKEIREVILKDEVQII